MKLILTLTFISFLTCLNGQNLNERLFIEYDEVINEIKSSDSIKDLEFKYEYDYILLLDSSEISLIEKINSSTIKYFRESAPGLAFNENTVGFLTEKKDIKDIFISNDLNMRIINCTNTFRSSEIKHETIDFPIYIKGNLAIFSISGPTWTQIYFATLKNYVLQINELYSIIE